MNSNYVHLGELDKNAAMMLEKLGFLQTHFVDVREELNMKFDTTFKKVEDKLVELE